jgi:outer membrane protein OmpA-like peptidoglycan-associated protein
MRATRCLLLATAAILPLTLASVQHAAAQQRTITAQAPAPAGEADPHAQKKREPGQPGQRPPGAPQQHPAAPPPAVQSPGAPPPAAQGHPPAAVQHPPVKEAQPPVQAPPQRPAQAQPVPPAPAAKEPPTKQAQPPAKQLPPPAPQAQPHPAPAPQPPSAQQQPAPGGAAQPRQAQPPAKQLPAPAPQPPAAQAHPPGAAPVDPSAAQQQPAQTPPASGQALPRPGGGGPATPPAAAQQPAPGPQPAPAAALPGPLAPAPQANANAQRLDQVRTERRETREGDRTVIREPGRVIIQEGGRTIIRHDEAERFRAIARDVRTERRGNETITVIVRPDGTQVVSTVDENGRLIRRARRWNDGREVVIIDNHYQGPAAGRAFVELPPPVIRIPREHYIVEAERASEADIYAALIAPPVDRIERRYTLDEVRYSQSLRERMPRVDVDTVNFDSGSWEVTPDQMDRLAPIAQAIQQAVQRNPAEVFLIEGHTDAVGADVDNLSLSDRRAESVAIALTQQFQVPAENLTTQGYGEQYLKVPTQAAERQNRRVTVRRITPLLSGGAQTGG